MAGSPGMHLGGILPRPAPRGRMASIRCHGRALRGYAAGICCRCPSERHWRAAAMKEPGALEGASTPPPRVGHLRCARPLVHAPQCFREVGALRSLRGAVCVLAPSPQGHGALLSALIAGAWGPLGRSWAATTARTFMAGAWESLFSGLIARSDLSLRCFGGQPWARFAFCGAVPYHVLKQNAL